MEIKRYVCYQEDGSIYKITNKPDERFQHLEVDFKEVEDFITGKKSLLEHKVEFDFVEKKYEIKSLKTIDEDKLMWAFLYELPRVKPDNNQIHVIKDNVNKCWKVMLDPEFDESVNKENIKVNLENYFFSITKKHDPNILYRLIRFENSNEIPFEHDFEFDQTDISVYTTRRFDNYFFEEVNE